MEHHPFGTVSLTGALASGQRQVGSSAGAAMSALPILAVQQLPRAGLLAH